MIESGQVPGLETGQRFATQWDPRDDYSANFDEEDEVLGEDAKGVWTTVHPLALFTAEPMLWGVVTQWRYGLRSMTRETFAAMSAFEAQAFAVLAQATNREEVRQARAGNGDDDDDEG